jgi:RimJ/RimL family protein N-acetyltransferase
VGIVLETRRLVLATMSLDDRDFMAQMLGDAQVMRFYPKRLSRDEAVASIRRMLDRYERYGFGPWLVREKSTGRPVGRVGLLPQLVDGVEEIEVGWMIHRPFQRCGFASEAGRACATYAFRQLHATHVISLIRPENVPSASTAQRLGMTHAGKTLHGGFLHDIYKLVSDSSA